MKTALRGITVAEFVRRLIERPGAGNWLMLVAPIEEAAHLGEQIAFGVAQEVEPDESPGIVHPRDADALVEALGRRRHLVITGVDDWPVEEWARLDTLRSRLLVAQRVAFVISEPAAKHLLIVAPHFARFFTGSVWTILLDEDVMDEGDRQAKVASMEAWSGLSTEEMVRRAECKELPAHPEYAEWLALVNRSDLL
jgi:hypothetical protein